MFSFFAKHKILSFLIVLGVAYFFVNPPHKFGLATGNFVVYNRIPFSFFDLFVNFDGSVKPLLNISDTNDLQECMRSLRETPSGDDMLLIVGTGFGKAWFRLSDTLTELLDARNIRSIQVPSARAVLQFNAAVSQDKRVAILLAVRH
jgi:hypothetical protein